MYESSFFKIITGSFTCTCLAGYSGDGKTCLPLPDKPMDIKVTAINPNEVTVTWYVANDTIIRYFTVEYKWFDKEWQFVKIQPNRTQAHLKDLDSDSSYLVRIGKSCMWLWEANTCNLFSTLLQFKLNSDAARFTMHPRIKPGLQQIRLLWILTSDWLKLRGSHAIHGSYVTYIGPVKRATCICTNFVAKTRTTLGFFLFADLNVRSILQPADGY